MEDLSRDVIKRLDALLGLALTRSAESSENSLPASCEYLRNLGFSNREIAGVLGKSVHHIEVVASQLLRKGKIKKQPGKRG